MKKIGPGQRVAQAVGEQITRALLVILRQVARLPYPVVKRAGEIAGNIAWVLARPRRHVTLVNLRMCFPQWTEAQRVALARAHFRSFMRSFFERFIFFHESAERVRALVQVRGVEHFDRVLGKPMVLLGPHFVGLDAGGMRFQLDHDAASMYAQQKSPSLNRLILEGRLRFGRVRLLLRNEGLRPAIRLIREGLPFYFLPDMDFGPRDAIFVPFFGASAATVTSLARIVRMTGASIVPMITRMTDTGYVIQVYPAWDDFPADDVEAATRYMNAFIEARVLEMPEQYLWSHKRFKTRPPGEPNPYRRAS